MNTGAGNNESCTKRVDGVPQDGVALEKEEKYSKKLDNNWLWFHVVNSCKSVCNLNREVSC